MTHYANDSYNMSHIMSNICEQCGKIIKVYHVFGSSGASNYCRDKITDFQAENESYESKETKTYSYNAFHLNIGTSKSANQKLHCINEISIDPFSDGHKLPKIC